MRQRSHFRNRRCLAKCRRRLGRAFALKPAEEASSSRSQSAAAVPDIDAPSRTVRPPFRLFDPFSARLGTRLWLGYPLGLSASALKAKLFGGYPSVSTQRLSRLPFVPPSPRSSIPENTNMIPYQRVISQSARSEILRPLRSLRPNLLGNLFYVSNLNRNGHIIVCRLRIIR